MSVGSGRSLYDTLNVTPDSDVRVIEAAYRVLMKLHHPDQAGPGGGSHNAAAQINQAYSILKDPARRAEYDRWLWARRQPPPGQPTQQIQPARRRTFAWSGWLVAGGLGCLLAVTMNARALAPQQEMDTGLKSVADSQPAQEAAQTIAYSAASALHIPQASTSDELPLAAVADLPDAADGSGRTTSPEDSETAAVPLPPPRPQRALQTPRRQKSRSPDEEFLERHGYIY